MEATVPYRGATLIAHKTGFYSFVEASPQACIELPNVEFTITTTECEIIARDGTKERKERYAKGQRILNHLFGPESE